ncbi:MAG: hypothetical protein LC774_02120 [Acidobacteria bacterium]|nr:hypothetical protein [Acidobacteriota bacterium]
MTNAARARGRGGAQTARVSGTSPTHASHHRLKSGKERTRSSDESAASAHRERVGAKARAIPRNFVRLRLLGRASRAIASRTRASLTDGARLWSERAAKNIFGAPKRPDVCVKSSTRLT